MQTGRGAMLRSPDVVSKHEWLMTSAIFDDQVHEHGCFQSTLYRYELRDRICNVID